MISSLSSIGQNQTWSTTPKPHDQTRNWQETKVPYARYPKVSMSLPKMRDPKIKILRDLKHLAKAYFLIPTLKNGRRHGWNQEEFISLDFTPLMEALKGQGQTIKKEKNDNRYWKSGRDKGVGDGGWKGPDPPRTENLRDQDKILNWEKDAIPSPTPRPNC